MLLILHITAREGLAWFQAALKKHYVKQKTAFDDVSIPLEKGCLEALLWLLYIGSMSINTISVPSKSCVIKI